MHAGSNSIRPSRRPCPALGQRPQSLRCVRPPLWSCTTEVSRSRENSTASGWPERRFSCSYSDPDPASGPICSGASGPADEIGQRDADVASARRRDLFGERVSDPAVADRAVADYLSLVAALPFPPADVWLSVDLSHLALGAGPKGAADRLPARGQGAAARRAGGGGGGGGGA